MLLTIPPHEENETIRQSAEPVTLAFLQKPETQELIDNMIETMREANGVGLAAPQLGIPIQLAVIETLPDYDDDGEPIEDTRKLYVIANPELNWVSRKLVTGIEGCLSILGYLGEVERPYAARIWALDRFGRRKRYRLKGWDARIFQHEIDHLNGVLYTDLLTAPDRYWTEDEYEAYIEELEAQALAEDEAQQGAALAD